MRPDQPARITDRQHRGELMEVLTLRGVHQRQRWCHRAPPTPLRECCAFFYFFPFCPFFPALSRFGGWAVLCVSRPLPFENPTCPGQKKRPAKIFNPKKLGVVIYIFNIKTLRISYALDQGPAHRYLLIYMFCAQGLRYNSFYCEEIRAH